MRRIQDRRRQQRPVHATVRDREGAALHLLDGELAVSGAPAEVGDRLLYLGELHAVRLAHHRHDEALLGADGDADVVVVLVDDVRAVDLGIHGGDFPQGLDAGLHEEAHEAQLHAVALLEQVLVLVPDIHDGAHVHVVERGEHRRRVLRILEAARDGLPQTRHLHAFLARRVVRHRRRAQLRCGDRRRRGHAPGRRGRLGHSLGRHGRRRPERRRQHILLQDLAAPAGTVHVVG